MDKLDQILWYLSSEDYRSYAARALGEQKRIVEEFGLKLERSVRRRERVGPEVARRRSRLVMPAITGSRVRLYM
jgi:hypothetical protein